jgi:hypothetical protein
MRTEQVILEYQPYIDYAPIAPKELLGASCSADEPTVNHWKSTWEKNVKANHDKFGSFKDHSIGKFYGYAHQKPVIIAGSGPSLKYNAHELKNREDITVISCLHNFHFMEDIGCPADFYVSLDAGEVVIEEVYEGGTKTEQEYWDLTKGRKLLCYIGTSPRLLEKWQGEVYFFNHPVPDENYIAYVEKIEKFNTYVSSGGNVLGGCFYIAKAFMGASIIGFIGADFCFSYLKKFHGWDSKYDAKLGNVLRVKDVFGNSVYTWKSYHNFKGWFESITLTVPGVYYNCSEGGTLGAYLEGNIRSIHQLPLQQFIRQMTMYNEIKEQALNPLVDVKKLLF